MEVPRVGVEFELQLPASATATATWEPSCICSLHCSLWQHQNRNSLSKARGQICILMDTSWVLNWLSHNGNPQANFFFFFFFWYLFLHGLLLKGTRRHWFPNVLGILWCKLSCFAFPSADSKFGFLGSIIYLLFVHLLSNFWLCCYCLLSFSILLGLYLIFKQTS